MTDLNPARVTSRVPGSGAIDLLRGSRSPGPVRQVAVPPAARRLSTLWGIDYEDGFVLETDSVHDLTAEQWARAMVEDAPSDTRSALRLGWRSLGLRLGPVEDEQRVLGWEILRSSPDFALLGAGSPRGLIAELLFKRHRGTLLFATLLKLENAVARAVWAGVAPGHRQVVRSLLEATSRRAARSAVGS
jgi:hypothetical protein